MVTQVIAQVYARACAGLDALHPLLIPVPAALGCVSAADVYPVGVDSSGPSSPDDTAVLEPVRPMLARGTVVTPWHQQVLVDAGVLETLVVPLPRVVVAGITEPGSASRTLALRSVIDCSGALVLPVDLPNDADLSDALEDQLVRADLLVVCDSTDSPGAAVRALQPVLAPDCSWAHHPVSGTQMSHAGPDAVPVVVLPASPAEQLVAWALFVRPVVQVLRGLAEVVPQTENVNDLSLEPSSVTVRLVAADGTSAGVLGAAVAVEVAGSEGAELIPLPLPPAVPEVSGWR